MGSNPFLDRAVLVTGASSGIGAALARRFAACGARLAITARRRDRLDGLAEELAAAGHVPPVVCAADLCDDDSAARIVDQVRAALGAIDVLVNNAGLGFAGAFAAQSAEQTDRMLRLNIEAVVRLTGLVLPEMLARRRGWLMNVASTAAYQPLPFLATYAATKAFVYSFSLALWAEVRRRGVVVTCLNPGTTRTEFFDHQTWSHARELIMKRAMSAERVADIGVRALAKGKPVAICGWGNRIGALVASAVPAPWVARAVAKVMKPPAG